MRKYSEEFCPRYARQQTVSYVDVMFIYLTFIVSLLLVSLFVAPINPKILFAVVPFTLMGLLFYKHAKYIMFNFPDIRLRYIIFLFLIVSAILYIVFIYKASLLPLTTLLFIFWAITFVTVLFWLKSSFTAKVYAQIHRKFEGEREQELNYYKNLKEKHNKAFKNGR